MNIQKIFFILLISITPHISAMFYDFRLRSAAARNDTATVIAHINHGIDINAQDEDTGNTALHEAATNGHAEMTKMLLEHGAQVYITNKDKHSPLHMAIKSNKNRACTKMLLKVELTDHANQLSERLKEL